MANAIYLRSTGNGSDRLIYADGANLINIRVRAGEYVEVDLADSTQDAVFNQAQYTTSGSVYNHKLKPSA